MKTLAEWKRGKRMNRLEEIKRMYSRNPWVKERPQNIYQDDVTYQRRHRKWALGRAYFQKGRGNRIFKILTEERDQETRSKNWQKARAEKAEAYAEKLLKNVEAHLNTIRHQSNQLAEGEADNQRLTERIRELEEALKESLDEIEYCHSDMLSMLSGEERSHPRGSGWIRVYDKGKQILQHKERE